MDDRSMDDLRRQTDRAILQGKHLLDQLTSPRPAWNLPARTAAAFRIKGEEDRRANEAAAARKTRSHDNDIDAYRHARASQRLTLETGPKFAGTMGSLAEVKSLVGGNLAAMRMDLHNNAEGRRAALEGRPINPANLQMKP